MPEKYWLDLPPKLHFRGLTPNEKLIMERRFEYLLSCRKVTVHDDPVNARKGWIIVYRGPEPPEADYPDDMGPWPGWKPEWPGAVDFSLPIPVGETKKGRLVTILMVTATGCRNLLLFGMPGSGKSVGASEIIATAAQDPTVEIWGADGGGGTDLEFWRERMTEYEILPERVFLMLLRLDAEIQQRGEAMAGKRRKIGPRDPKILVYMEEFATFTDEKVKRSYETGLPCGAKEQGEKLIDLQARCMRLGRKNGVGFLCVTQVPTVDAVPGKLRRLFQYRWGFFTLEAAAWRAGFGSGIRFVHLDIEKAGDSVLVAETGIATRMRSYFIPDNILEEIAAATSLAPVESLAPAMDTFSADLCLENPENAVAPPDSTVAPSAAPTLRLGPWDRAILLAALDGRTGPDLYGNLVGGRSAGSARKRLVALERAGYLSAEQPRVTSPKVYMTTVTGRAEIAAVEVSNIPDGRPAAHVSDSGLPEELAEQRGTQ